MRILITGCAKPNNIGFMVAQKFKEIETKIEIIAINHPSNMMDRKNYKELISSEYACDLANIDSIVHTCELISKYEEKIDIFIHAAGVSSLSCFEDIDYRKFCNTITTNAIAPVIIMKELLGKLKGSTCLLISSNASHKPMRCSLAYNMSKAALTMAMRQMARELTRPNEMTIFSISPNKLKNTGMGEIIDEVVPVIRNWSREEYDALQLSATMNGELNDPIELSRFIVNLLSNKDSHKMMSGSDLPYGE